MKNRLNELSLLITSLIYMIPLLLSSNWKLNLILLALAMINLIFVRTIRFRYLAYFLLVMIFPLISLFITVLLYTKGASASPICCTILGFSIREMALSNAIYLTTRAFALSTVSFTFLTAIRYDALVFAMMQVFKLPPAIGYSLLATFNAFLYMKDEFLRIRLAWRNRFGKNRFPLSLIFPVLVSASRYAHYAGLSLECRGLNKDKSYLEIHLWKTRDWIYVMINIFQIVLLTFISSGALFEGFRLR